MLSLFTSRAVRFGENVTVIIGDNIAICDIINTSTNTNTWFSGKKRLITDASKICISLHTLQTEHTNITNLAKTKMY